MVFDVPGCCASWVVPSPPCSVLSPLCIQARQRHVAVRLVHVADDGAASALFDEAHAFPDEDCGAKAVVLGYSPTYGVVVEPGGLRRLVLGAGAPGGADRCEAVFFVLLEGLHSVFATQLDACQIDACMHKRFNYPYL